MISSTIAPGAGLRAKNRGEILRAIEQVRKQAGTEMRAAFPRALKRFALPHLPASTISKARKASLCCPAFRVGLCILALRIGGAPKERAQRLVDWFQALVDRLWADEETPTPRELARREQEIDGAEDLAETDYLMGIPGARERWLGFLQERRAHDGVLIISLQAEGASS